MSLLSFDGDSLDVTPIEDVGGPDGFHFVLADLGAGKDTVRILRDLQAAYPTASTDEYQRLHELLGPFNAKTCAAAVDAMARGDARELGEVYARAQAAFDERAGAVCPTQLGHLGSPVLRAVLTSERMREFAWGGKGVGSQGDGTVQLLCRGEAGMAGCEEVLRRDFGLVHTIRLVIPPRRRDPSSLADA